MAHDETSHEQIDLDSTTLTIEEIQEPTTEELQTIQEEVNGATAAHIFEVALSNAKTSNAAFMEKNASAFAPIANAISTLHGDNFTELFDMYMYKHDLSYKLYIYDHDLVVTDFLNMIVGKSEKSVTFSDLRKLFVTQRTTPKLYAGR